MIYYTDSKFFQREFYFSFVSCINYTSTQTLLIDLPLVDFLFNSSLKINKAHLRKKENNIDKKNKRSVTR